MLTLLFLSSILTSTFCCEWLTEYRDLRNTSMSLIQLMGGPFTNQECPVPFPNGLYDQVQETEVKSQLVFIRDSMKEIYDMYHRGNLSSTTWDPVKTTEFLESVNRQIKELSSCVSGNKHQTATRLRRYYRILKNRTLYCTGGSTASWELVRKETKRHLERLDLLGNTLRYLASSSVV